MKHFLSFLALITTSLAFSAPASQAIPRPAENIALHKPYKLSPTPGYRFWTADLRAHGRYAAIVVSAADFTFADEIEIYRGENAWLNQPLASEVFDTPAACYKAGAQRTAYTPLFLDPTSVTAGKQMEAIREGVEDYEYFVMLKDAVEKAEKQGRNDAALKKAKDLLVSGAPRVLEAPNAGTLNWSDAKDRSLADRVRVEILNSLEVLTGN